MKVLPTLLTGLTLLGSVMAPMAKADLSSQYNQQQNAEQQLTRICQETWQNSQYEERYKDGSDLARYFIDDNNRIFETKWNGYQSQRCRFMKALNGVPLNMVRTNSSGYQVQYKIEGNNLVRYGKSPSGSVGRGVWGESRF